MGYSQAASAYAALDPALISPGRAEARVFTEAARRLRQAFTDPASFGPAQINALHDNRRLWTTAAIETASDANELPDALRASIISLAAFVDRHTSAVLREEAAPDALIDLNTRIATGLSAGAR
jgi:flagellar protein FlaF